MPAHDELLAAFYDELYLPAFAHQREPLDAWREGLRRDDYALTIEIEGDHLLDPARRRIDGGIAFERYPESGCGLLTYVVVAPGARRRGLGRALIERARAALGAPPLVLGEISLPDSDEARARLARFERWGARVVDVAYVQPDLGFGRDAHLALIAFDPPPVIDGTVLRAFLTEFYRVVEGCPSPISVPDRVAWHVPGTFSGHAYSSDPAGIHPGDRHDSRR